jgi:TonB family protein
MKTSLHNSSGARPMSAFHTLVILTILAFMMSCNNSKNTTGQNEVPPSPPPPPANDSVYVNVDTLPRFTGGDSLLLNFIAKNTVYPAEAKKNNITGRVILKFVVEKDCTISDVSVLKGVDPMLDAEAVRVVKTLPKFERPAIKGGIPVRVHYVIPISFMLN